MRVFYGSEKVLLAPVIPIFRCAARRQKHFSYKFQLYENKRISVGSN